MKSFAVCGASLVLVLSLCSAAHAQPLTVKGSITVGGSTGGTASLHLVSSEFDLSFRLDDAFGPWNTSCGNCNPNTVEGLGLTISGQGAGSGTIKGTSYSTVYLSGFLQAAADVVLPQPQPGDVATVSAPFVFTGIIHAYENASDIGNRPAFYTANMIARGVVTANLQRDSGYPGYDWRVATATYQFDDPDLTVPYPWLSGDVGAVGQPGSSSYANGAFTIGGSGADVWGTDDALQFVSQVTPAKSLEIVARVTGQENTDPLAKAGVMIRQSYDSNAADLMLDRTPQGGVEFLTRQSPSGDTTFVGGTSVSSPVWLKLRLVDGTATAAVSSDGSTWTSIGATPWPPASGRFSAGYAGLAVSSRNNSAVSHATFDNVTISDLTVDDFETDIGEVGQSGWATLSNGMYTIAGAGADIWGTADAFHYVYAEGNVGGGGDPRQTGILARVTSIENTHPYAKAGLDIRAGLTASAAHVILDVTPIGGIEFMTRSSDGAQTTVIASASHAAPVWLKLVENGTVITGAYSDDGYQWTTVGTTNFAPASDSLFEPFIGMAVTSHDTSVLNVATFDHVRFATAGSDFTPTIAFTSPADGATFTAPATIQIAATALDQDGTIAKVDFFGSSDTGASFFATDTTSPYTATWSNLAAGTYSISARATDNSGGVGDSGALTIIVTSGSGGGGSTPFTGTPVSIPGTIEAENFDNGGEGVAYHDSDAGNNGGQYRSTDVDIEATSDAGGGDDVGWIAADEWLNYTVNVTAAGSYKVEARVASLGQGGTFHIEAAGADVSGPLTIPDTGDWQSWTTISDTVSLNAGTQIVRVVMDSAGAISVGNINWLRFSTATSEGGGTPIDIVVYASDVPSTALHGSWTLASDSSSPNSVALATPDNGFASTDAPLASPADYVDVRFSATANTPYTIWLRMKALNDLKSNDSVWVQFSDALANGSAAYGIGTTAGLLVNLATDSTAASLRNWGWQNTAYWLSQATTLTFASSGVHIMRIQVREDGVEVDQIVLSPSTYAMNPPGPVTNDTTIVAKP